MVKIEFFHQKCSASVLRFDLSLILPFVYTHLFQHKPSKAKQTFSLHNITLHSAFLTTVDFIALFWNF